MKDILQDIIANKRIEVDRQKQAVQLRTLLALGGERLERTTYSMRASLAASSSGIIAEFKRKSPSKGWLHPDAAIPNIIPASARHASWLRFPCYGTILSSTNTRYTRPGSWEPTLFY